MTRTAPRPAHCTDVPVRVVAACGVLALAAALGCDRPGAGSATPSDDSVPAGRRPFLRAEPNPVPGAGHLAATTIRWDTGDGTSGRLVVAVDGGRERLIATGAAGVATADWIAPKTRYHFALYGEREQGAPALARIQVARTRAWPVQPATLTRGLGMLLAAFCFWVYWRINLRRA